MRSLLTISSLRRRSAVALGAAGLVVTAACSDDAVTAPESKVEVPTSQSTIIPSITQEVTVRIKDIYGNLLPDIMTPTEWLALTATNDTVLRRIAYDNHLNPDYHVDLNPLQGVVTLKMPYAYKQRVCLYNFTTYYAFDMYQPHCNEVVSNGALKIDAGTLVMRRKPEHTFTFKDWFGVTLTGGGATLHITGGPFNNYDNTFVEGGQMDPGAADGKITFRPDFPGTYNWCETVPPTGFKLTQPTCGTLTLSWEGKTSQTLSHMPKILLLQ